MCNRLTKLVIRYYVIHFFSVYSMIRHYGFYPKRTIRHYVIHPTILTLKSKVKGNMRIKL